MHTHTHAHTCTHTYMHTHTCTHTHAHTHIHTHTHTHTGKPYDGKASDMWAMGVLLYTMLYGQFPFYDNDPQELFRKIKTADYTLPT